MKSRQFALSHLVRMRAQCSYPGDKGAFAATQAAPAEWTTQAARKTPTSERVEGERLASIESTCSTSTETVMSNVNEGDWVEGEPKWWWKYVMPNESVFWVAVLAAKNRVAEPEPSPWL